MIDRERDCNVCATERGQREGSGRGRGRGSLKQSWLSIEGGEMELEWLGENAEKERRRNESK